jgi:hypothetical protein
MIEMAQPIDAIVANHAACAKLLLMIGHKYLVILSMAIYASLDINNSQAIWMAGGAIDNLVGIVHSVQRQTKPGCSKMVKGLTF